MTIYIGADHGGFEAKEHLKNELASAGYEVTDCGASSLQPDDDYPVYGAAVAKVIGQTPGSLGILLCRSGHGMVMTANKVPGVRAMLAVNEASVRQGREHDDGNVLVFGVDYTSQAEVWPLTKVWLESTFLGGKHQRRLDEIAELEADVQTGAWAALSD